jgi:hypothetical protein
MVVGRAAKIIFVAVAVKSILLALKRIDKGKLFKIKNYENWKNLKNVQYLLQFF